LQTLKLIIENLVDAYLSNDFAKVQKVSKLKWDNHLVKANILCCCGGLEFLMASGFVKSAEDASVIEFKGFDEKLIMIRDALRTCCAIQNGSSTVRDVEGEIKSGKEQSLFGPRPACYGVAEQPKEWNDVWADVREIFGSDGPDASPKNSSQSRRTAGVWIFSGAGLLHEAERKKLVDSLMLGVRKDFETVSKNSELDKVDWDDVLMYNKRLMHVRCPECEQDQEWTGPVDGMSSELHVQACSKCSKPLSAQMTGARKLLSFVGACAVDGEFGATRCEKCAALGLGKTLENCTVCV
jgi:hypothetical protein